MRLGDLDALKKEFEKVYPSSGGVANKQIYNIIDNAQPVEPYCYFCGQKEHGIKPQSEFVKMLNERIENSVCKFCQMNKHCELCEISRVFMIIALTDKEMNEGCADMRGEEE